MFSETDDEVAFIDFQMMSLSHPARDIWYFLAVNTDKVGPHQNKSLKNVDRSESKNFRPNFT
jgi:aminoglycoside phosphotransferase (APT) family kinase protein